MAREGSDDKEHEEEKDEGEEKGHYAHAKSHSSLLVHFLQALVFLGGVVDVFILLLLYLFQDRIVHPDLMPKLLSHVFHSPSIFEHFFLHEILLLQIIF